ncbi:MAG: hypothetical protein VYE77_06895 [Planctomycetota bacterium]|nr:hypothetical protein [Planctomycetota bacterium]
MEQVFVVHRRGFFSGNWPQGFLALDAASARDLLRKFAASGEFVPRDQAEENPAWKQLIPYCVLRTPDRVLCVQRKSAQTESRLHGKLSIGIGGHINPEPGQTPDQASNTFTPSHFESALRRELTEELHGADGRKPLARFCGLLNDDENPVGRVHTGLVYTLDWPATRTDAELPTVREVSKMSGSFRSLAEMRNLWEDPARLETWTRTLVEAGIAGAAAVPRQPNTTPHSSRPARDLEDSL